MPLLTDSQIARAQSVNLLEYARTSGCELHKEGRDYRIKGFGGLQISEDGQRWKCFSQNVGGGPIQFVQFMEGVSWADAARKLLSLSGNVSTYRSVPTQQSKPKMFQLPPPSTGFNRMFAYLLKTRGLEPAVVNKLVRDKQLYEDERHNCVFVGKDKDGVPKYAGLRGTYTNGQGFKGEVSGSDKSISFCIHGQSDRVFVFESAIDAMSHASLCHISGKNWEQDSRLSLGGLSDKALSRFLDDHANVKHISFCLDNDANQEENHGQNAAATFFDKYSALGYTADIQIPLSKDFNAELLSYRSRQALHEQEAEEEMEM